MDWIRRFVGGISFSRVGVALHVLRGRPTIYRATFIGRAAIRAFLAQAEATDNLLVTGCTFDFREG